MLARAKSAVSNAGSAVSNASDATARGAKQAKLKAEILLLQNKIKSAKTEFGLPIYDAMAENINGPEVDRIFNEARLKIEALQAEIDTKRELIEVLNQPSRGSFSSSGDVGWTPSPPSTDPLAPPAGPPPSAPAAADPPPTADASPAVPSLPRSTPPFVGLPDGWKSTKTAEGKEYYYKEATGETSWSVPIS